MASGLNESLNDKLEQASLKELMPGFDKDLEWNTLSKKLHPPKVGIQNKVSSIAAAVLAILFCGGGLTWLIRQPHFAAKDVIAIHTDTVKDPMHEWIKSAVISEPEDSIQIAKPVEEKVQPLKIKTVPAPKPQAINNDNIVTTTQPVVASAVQPKRHIDKKRMDELFEYYRTKEFICNSTPCPLQICILQTIRCKNEAPSEIATCSTIEPDQAGQLKYKVNNSTHDCNVSVDEIRITRVNTGETIVLNANSKPSTAQDLFDYITCEKEGDLLTGIFKTDCNKNTTSQNITIDKGYGNFIIK